MIALFLFSIAFVTLWTPWVVALADGTLDEYEITPLDANKVEDEEHKKIGEKKESGGDDRSGS